MEERKEPQPQAPPIEQIAKEIPDTDEVSGEMVQAGIKPTQTQFTAKVTDDTGKPMITSPATQNVTVTIPAAPTQLLNWSKGSPAESITWFASFWLRVIKKALHFGWKVVMKGGQPDAGK